MIRKFATQTKKIGFEENEGFVMINVLIFSDSLTIYIVSGCQLLTYFEEKKQKIASGCRFFDYNSVSSSFSRKSFPTLAGITFLLQQEALSA